MISKKVYQTQRVLKSSSSTFNMLQQQNQSNNQTNSKYNFLKYDDTKPIQIIQSTEEATVKYIGGPLVKKPIKHVHQKSMSENMNAEPKQNPDNLDNYKVGGSNLKNKPTESEERGYELDLSNVLPIKNIFLISNSILTLEDLLDPLHIEGKVDSLLDEILNINPESYDCFNQSSNLGLNKRLFLILKHYTIMIIMVKFGILEFLLNNLLQKKIKQLLKILNCFLVDFVSAFVYSYIDKASSCYNGSSQNSTFQISKDLQDLMFIFSKLSKKYPGRVLNAWSLDHQEKIYESKSVSQLKLFLE